MYRNFVLRTHAFKLQYITVLIAPRLLVPTENYIWPWPLMLVYWYTPVVFFPSFSSSWTLLSCSGLGIQRFLFRRQILLHLKSPLEPSCPIKQLFAPHFLPVPFNFFMHQSFLYPVTWIELAFRLCWSSLTALTFE